VRADERDARSRNPWQSGGVAADGLEAARVLAPARPRRAGLLSYGLGRTSISPSVVSISVPKGLHRARSRRTIDSCS
jgi:hypothetical protein